MLIWNVKFLVVGKFIIVSPSTEKEDTLPTIQEIEVILEKEETLMEFQNKVQKGARRQTTSRSTRCSPNILKGTSSKKKKMSQIRNSPENAKRTSTASTSRRQTNSKPSIKTA